MKFLAVFVAVLALAAGSFSPVAQMTLQEIDQALNDPNTDPAMIPYLIEGLNTIMANLMAGDQQTTVLVPMPVNEVVTLDELTAAVHNPSTDPAVLPYLEDALHELMVAMNNGQEEDSIILSIPAMNVNYWTLDQLSAAIQNPETDHELMIYLEHALDTLMAQLFAGNQVSSIAVITPPGVVAEVPAAVPVFPQPVVPTPVVPQPVVPAPVPGPVAVFPLPEETSPVVPAPVVAEPVVPVASSAPLVQLIINVNANQQVAGVNPAPVVAAEETPMESVVPAVYPDRPMPVATPVAPTPVAVVEQPEVVSPIAVVEAPESMPIGVVTPIVVAPVINPIDVVAVAAPEVNPIDVIAPVPAVVGAVDQGIIV